MLKRFFITLGIITIVAVSIYGCYRYLISTPVNSTKEAVVIEIKEGTGKYQLAKSMAELGAVRSALAFYIYTEISGKIFQEGYYSLPFNLSTTDLAGKLESGELAMYRIEIPQGKRLEQIAAMLEDRKFFNYDEIVASAKGKEGRLFPDVYYVLKNATAGQFVRMMEDRFDQKTKGLNFTEQDLVLASIIERESVKDEERATVAGIFKNRLDSEMRLESDPTVLYVYDSRQIQDITPYDATQYTFWKPINFSLYRTIDSPYNTYLYKGLPPKPICSPSIPSIKAAMNPEINQYFFFFHDSTGQIYTSRTNEEHEALKEKYLK